MRYTLLTDLVSSWKESLPGLKLIAKHEKNRVVLYLIDVPAQRRRQGYGTEILTDLCEYADWHGLDVFCTPTDEYGTPPAVLTYFYQQHGFEYENAERVDMKRTPSFQ